MPVKVRDRVATSYGFSWVSGDDSKAFILEFFNISSAYKGNEYGAWKKLAHQRVSDGVRCHSRELEV